MGNTLGGLIGWVGAGPIWFKVGFVGKGAGGFGWFPVKMVGGLVGWVEDGAVFFNGGCVGKGACRHDLFLNILVNFSMVELGNFLPKLIFLSKLG